MDGTRGVANGHPGRLNAEGCAGREGSQLNSRYPLATVDYRYIRDSSREALRESVR